MRKIAIAMHDRTHLVTHHLVEVATTAASPRPLEFIDRLLPAWARQITTAPAVIAETELPRFGRLKTELGLGDDDVLVVLVEGNLKDEENDEYFSVSSSASTYSSFAATCPGVAIVSYFFAVNPRSAFNEPQADLTRQQKREWWDPKTDERKAVLCENALLLVVLGIVATLATGLPEHEDVRGCIMDYCQEPFDIMQAFKDQIAFTFCPACREHLASPEGQQLLAIAGHLTANPFRQRQPRIFVSYAREDAVKAERLRVDLSRRGFDVWKDNRELLAGEDWSTKIEAALNNCDFAVVCLSKATAKSGYFQQELRRAVRMAASTPGYALPVHFEACELPQGIAAYHAESLFPNWDRGVTELARAISSWWTRRLDEGTALPRSEAPASDSDREAFLRSRGGWKGLVDAQALISNIRESRRVTIRPEPDV
jgi:hypothetical protein